MKILLAIFVLSAMMIGCSGGQEKAKAEAALKAQADIAKSKLQEKADAMARAAANPPPGDNNAKSKKP